MEKIIERFKTVRAALDFLNRAIEDFENLKEERYREHLRNSKIQSFEFCVDTLWKFLKLYFEKEKGMSLEASPKSVFRNCFKFGLTTEEDTKKLLKMVDDRNISSHTYHEELAETLNKRVGEYYQLMNKIVEQVESNLPN